MTIKAIETKYGGYRFRSRKEARFAVMFDALGWHWEFEPEGFRLGDDIYYLPDFFIHDLALWIEVKGKPPTEEEFTKATRLTLGTGNPTLITWQDFTGHTADNTILFMVNNQGVFHSFQPAPSWNTMTREAWEAARSARFEFGESGNPRPRPWVELGSEGYDELPY